MSQSIESTRTVLIDMDSTLFDFEAPIVRALAERGIHYADPSTDFYIAKRYQDPSTIAFIHAIQTSKGFFQNLEPLPGALEAWTELQEKGYTPRICSKPLRANPFCIDEKREAVDAYFGPQAADQAYIGSNKEAENGIALIDDRPGLVNGEYWQRVIFTQPWNKHEGGLRIDSWNDPRLFPILANCAERYDQLFG